MGAWKKKKETHKQISKTKEEELDKVRKKERNHGIKNAKRKGFIRKKKFKMRKKNTRGNRRMTKTEVWKVLRQEKEKNLNDK